ncbi:septum formation initiator family protein [Candidatus Nomurabacteria bacterium]|nr:septum formation initiator family protein [Candidatus Nomurabacteria bacterium]
MAKFNKQQEHKLWHSPLALIVLFLIVVLFSYNTIGLIIKERETNKNKESELMKIDDLRKREASLSSDISKLSTDEGKEESIRDKFQVVRPGEKMVVIVDEEQKTEIVDSTANDYSFWGFIKRTFSKKE